MNPEPRRSGSAIAQLSSWLAVHLSDSGRTVAEVADELGVSEETVRSWLAGHRPGDEDGAFAHLDTPAKLGGWLRARIADSGCSVRQIAETTENVSRVTIYYWIRGEYLPKPPTGDAPDRFDQLLSNPRLGLSLRERVELDEVRRRLTGTSLNAEKPVADWASRALPADDRAFFGRNQEQRRLDRLLREHRRGRSVVVAALTGIGGVGKTALAVHWARSRAVKARFVDGCLYVNLNGYADLPPTDPHQALAGLLEQLGVDPEAVPDDPDALAARYQEALRGKRMLIVLDNAHAEPQVRPLIPTEPDCLVLITSRSQLDGLRATHSGAVHLPLDTLSGAEAASLLRGLLGRPIANDAEADEIAAFADACGRLPLAIHIAAANHRTHHARTASVGDYARMLTENRLGRLNVGPTDPSTSVAVVFDRSYRHLSAPAQRTYRLLGLHPGLDLSPALATSLTGMSADDTAAALMELTRASLLTKSLEGRYSLHDLLREHATALAERTDSEAERRKAMRRLLDHYTHTACPAAAMIRPSIDELAIPLGVPSPGTAPESLTEREAARAWFQAEHAGMAAVVLRQPAGELDVQVWQSGWALSGFYYVRGHMRDQVVLQLAALGAAERIGDSAAQVHSHRVLAWSYTGLGRFEDSRAHLLRALRLAVAAEDRIAQAATHHGLANLAALQGHHGAALEHSQWFLELSSSQGSRIGVSRALNAVGWYHAQLGEYKEAIEYCERALDACQAVESDLRPHLEAAVLDSLGFIHHRLGRYERARSCYDLALARVREAGSRRGEGEVLSSLGELHLSAGDPDAAREALQEALGILTDIGHAGAADLRRRLADL
ncbi:tetratricopeptide repeat protein [Glycomyces sp. MUSA5-2]|uniref:tetratricopeptide repeat protein n=1 Tax=Glycomyces sp. MUSA5-2 TaxID=2053002 RepID=UPI00300B3754